MHTSSATHQSLVGMKVLVVEDDYFIAQDTCNTLIKLGAQAIGPVASVDAALSIARSRHDIDAAVLDINLRGVAIFPFADVLRAARVPFVFATGYDRSVIPSRFHDVKFIEKPIEPTILMRVLR